MNNLEKYNEAFIMCFQINEEQLSNLVYQAVPTWDSIGHMSLISALEERFDIMIETDDMIDFSSYAKGKDILKKYNVTI
jgi:acyl carrier protein